MNSISKIVSMIRVVPASGSFSLSAFVFSFSATICSAVLKQSPEHGVSSL